MNYTALANSPLVRNFQKMGGAALPQTDWSASYRGPGRSGQSTIRSHVARFDACSGVDNDPEFDQDPRDFFVSNGLDTTHFGGTSEDGFMTTYPVENGQDSDQLRLRVHRLGPDSIDSLWLTYDNRDGTLETKTSSTPRSGGESPVHNCLLTSHEGALLFGC